MNLITGGAMGTTAERNLSNYQVDSATAE